VPAVVNRALQLTRENQITLKSIESDGLPMLAEDLEKFHCIDLFAATI
jgi:hypothetical protein